MSVAGAAIAGGIASAASSLGGSIITNITNGAMNKQNIDFQREMNNQIFAREDSAYQRTVKDMIAAGLSPSAMLSTNSSGGSASAPGNSFAQDWSGMSGLFAGASDLLSLYDMAADIQSKEILNAQASQDLSYSQAHNLPGGQISSTEKVRQVLQFIADSFDPNSAEGKLMERTVKNVTNGFKKAGEYNFNKSNVNSSFVKGLISNASSTVRDSFGSKVDSAASELEAKRNEKKEEINKKSKNLVNNAHEALKKSRARKFNTLKNFFGKKK